LNTSLAHEKYIKYLITQRKNFDEVNDILNTYSLPTISQNDWETIYNEIFSLRIPKKIKDYWLNKNLPQPKDYSSILKSFFIDLDDAHKNSENFKLSFSILDNEESSKIAKAMIIKKLPSEDISALLNGKMNIGFNVESVKLYEKYFFNVRHFTRIEWKKYYSSLSDNQDKKFIIDCFQNNLEDLKIILGLHAKISYTDSLQLIHVMAMNKIKSLSRDRNPLSDSGARKWVDVALKTGDRYEKYKSKTFTDFSKEVQMEFDYDEYENKISYPSISELKGEIV